MAVNIYINKKKGVIKIITLKTDCKDCVHAKICRNKDNAKHAMNKLMDTIYRDGPNDDYSWDIIMQHKNVNIEFSCPDFMKNIGNTHNSSNERNEGPCQSIKAYAC